LSLGYIFFIYIFNIYRFFGSKGWIPVTSHDISFIPLTKKSICPKHSSSFLNIVTRKTSFCNYLSNIKRLGTNSPVISSLSFLSLQNALSAFISDRTVPIGITDESNPKTWEWILAHGFVWRTEYYVTNTIYISHHTLYTNYATVPCSNTGNDNNKLWRQQVIPKPIITKFYGQPHNHKKSMHTVVPRHIIIVMQDMMLCKLLKLIYYVLLQITIFWNHDRWTDCSIIWLNIIIYLQVVL
jgi:hypothetical protein